MFKGIEGMRGWLAWAVVFSHIIHETTLSSMGSMKAVSAAGSYAVIIFIIISGFVITNLILKKKEPYAAYIARRLLRIYPAYLVALVLGAIVTLAIDHAASKYSLDPDKFSDLYDQSRYLWEAPTAHVLLHLSLLHGMVPNNVLQNSQYTLVPPAWSLSLEFQFYLIAPFAVMAVRKCPIPAVAAIVMLEIAYAAGVFGSFGNPSLIFGAGWYFLVGIGTRLFIDRFPTFDKFPWGLAIAALFIGMMDRRQLPLSIWICVVIYIRSGAISSLLDGAIPQFMGARSYSVYILHMPIVMGAVVLSYGPLGLNGVKAIAAVTVFSVLAVAAAAEVVYRWIELPAINFGKTMGREPVPVVAGW